MQDEYIDEEEQENESEDSKALRKRLESQFVPRISKVEAPSILVIEHQEEVPKVTFQGVEELPVWDMKRKIAEITKLPDLVNIRVPGLLNSKQSTQGSYNGIQFDSYWEFAFYLYHSKIRGAYVTRNTTESFDYVDENHKMCKFYPDFTVDGQYYEIKGIYRTKDLLKKQATLGRVTFIGPEEIKPIIKAVYARIPNWKELYHEEKHKTKLGKY